MPPTPEKTGTGFVGLQQYLDANQPAVQGTAGNLAQQDSDAASKAGLGATALGFEHRANRSADPTTLAGYAQARGNLQDAAANLGGAAATQTDTHKDEGLDSFGGLQQQLNSAYGNTSTPYTAGDNNLDANLLTADTGAQGRFKAAQDHFSGLDTYLDKATAGAGPGHGFGNGFTDGRAPAGPAPTLNDPGYNGPHKASAAQPKEQKYYDTEGQSGIVAGPRRNKGGDQVEGSTDDSYGGDHGQYGGGGGNQTVTDDAGNTGVNVVDSGGHKTGFIPDPKPTTQDGGVTVTNGDGTQTGYIPQSEPTATLDPSQQDPTFWDRVQNGFKGVWNNSMPGQFVNGFKGKK